MSPNAKLIYTTRMPVRWGDMDAYNHVNNTVYFRYLEQTRVEWLEQIGGRVSPDEPITTWTPRSMAASTFSLTAAAPA